MFSKSKVDDVQLMSSVTLDGQNNPQKNFEQVMLEGGFTMFKARKKGSRRFLTRSAQEKYSKRDCTLTVGQINLTTRPDILEQIRKCTLELKKGYVEIFNTAVCHSLGKFQDIPYFHQIVCFGIGPFSRDVSALYQLALLVHLYRDLHYAPEVVIYDPIFNDFELEMLRTEFGFKVLTTNTECRYPIGHLSSLTFFYMIHLTNELNSNLIESNLDSLEHVVIFGNSLRSIYPNLANRFAQCARMELLEWPVSDQTFHYDDVFHQQTVQRFATIKAHRNKN